MDEIINKILKIEERAQKVMYEAEQEKSSLEGQLAARLNGLEAEIEKKEKEKISEEKRDRRAKTELMIDGIKKRAEEQKIQLEKKSGLDKNKWVNEIFKGIFNK